MRNGRRSRKSRCEKRRMKRKKLPIGMWRERENGIDSERRDLLMDHHNNNRLELLNYPWHSDIINGGNEYFLQNKIHVRKIFFLWFRDRDTRNWRTNSKFWRNEERRRNSRPTCSTEGRRILRWLVLKDFFSFFRRHWELLLIREGNRSSYEFLSINIWICRLYLLVLYAFQLKIYDILKKRIYNIHF